MGNLTFPIGTLQYESMVASLPMFSFPFILIFVAAGLLIIIILIVYIKYRQKSRENDRVMKDMQNQMDTLEAKVAKECKEGKCILWHMDVISQMTLSNAFLWIKIPVLVEI